MEAWNGMRLGAGGHLAAPLGLPSALDFLLAPLTCSFITSPLTLRFNLLLFNTTTLLTTTSYVKVCLSSPVW